MESFRVFYLCRTVESRNEFVFPNELPENYYSPGLFVIQKKIDNEFSSKYSFAARQGEQLLDLDLVHGNDLRTFKVEVQGIGIYVFKAVSLDREDKYVGNIKSAFLDAPLWRLEPANMLQLERACRMHDFYFVGATQ